MVNSVDESERKETRLGKRREVWSVLAVLKPHTLSIFLCDQPLYRVATKQLNGLREQS